MIRTIILFTVTLYSTLSLANYKGHERNTLQEMVDIINKARADHGLHQLYTNWNLGDAANNHARDMANRNYTGHRTPEGWSPDMRIKGAGYPSHARTGEIIAYSFYEPLRIFQSWMSDAPHAGAIFNSNYYEVGVGHYYNPNSYYGHYWVVTFGNRY